MENSAVHRLWSAAPAVLVAMAAVAFWRPTLDVFNTAKATVIVGGALVVVMVRVLGALRRGVIAVPTGPWVLSAVAFVVVLTASVMAHLVSGTGGLGDLVGGSPGRHGGWALYVAGVLLAVVAGRAGNRAREDMVGILVLGSLPVSGYVLVQAAGLDPLVWATVEGGVPAFSTFGNVDFASAWLGIAAVLGVGMAVEPACSRRQRQVMGVTAGLAGLGSVLTGSLQGPVILIVGAGVLRLWRVLLADGREGRRGPVVAGVVVVLLGVGLVATSGGAQQSLETRFPKWSAAVAMTADAPLVGRGLDTYGDWFFAALDADTAARSGLRRRVDNAHNVPLNLMAGGGVPVMLAWLAFVVVLPAGGVLRAIRSTPADEGQVATAHGPVALAVIAAWLGYLVQALVSIDVPPLLGLGMLLTGLVASATGMMQTRVVPLREGRAAGRSASWRWPVGAALVLLVLVLLVQVIRPWQADRMGWQAQFARIEGDVITAEEATGNASRLAPWDGRFAAAQGGWLTGLGRYADALDHQLAAAVADPRSLAVALNVARLEDRLDRQEAALASYRRVLEIDPTTPAVLAEVGGHLVRVALSGSAPAGRGDLGEQGRRLLAQAISAVEAPPPAWTDALAGDPQSATVVGQTTGDETSIGPARDTE